MLKIKSESNTKNQYSYISKENIKYSDALISNNVNQKYLSGRDSTNMIFSHKGEKLNYKTANLLIPDKKVIPAYGVYKGIISIENKKYDAIANFGLRPTFSDIENPLLEIHIFDFEKNIYNTNVEFEFVDFLRKEIKFKNEQELKTQIKEDIKSAFGIQ